MHLVVYMFLLKSKGGKLSVLNGGSIKSAGIHTIDYFFTNMENYANSIKMFLTSYESYQKEIAKEIKSFGGDGIIHGCIIDIDFFNHVYVNPLDLKVTPYFAYAIDDKYI